MNIITKITVIGVLALTVGALATANARTFPASQGDAVNHAADANCFSLWYSSITNTCSTTKSFEIPVSADSSGSKTAYAWAYGASSANNVGCQAFGLNNTVTTYWASPRVYLPGFGSSKQLTMTGAYVPSWGYMYINCQMNPSGRVNSVGYNE